MSSVAFPASVACLLLLFFLLNVVDLVVGDKKTRKIVQVIDVPVSSNELHTCLVPDREVEIAYVVRLDLLYATSTFSLRQALSCFHLVLPLVAPRLERSLLFLVCISEYIPLNSYDSQFPSCS